MESTDEPFTAVLTIDPGPVIDDSPAHGFAESEVILGTADRAPGSALVDLRWGAVQLATGITTAAFLHEFWRGAGIAHVDALDFGRTLLGRLLGHPKLRERWAKIQGWRGTRPLRLELILPPAASSTIGAIPFELLADDTTFLFYAGHAVLVRCIRDLEPRRAALRRGDRLIVAWANPTNIDERFDDAVFEQHETVLSAAGTAAHLDVRPPVARAGLAQLQDALANHGPVPVISLVAHGYPTGGQLALENPDRTSQPVTASDIAAAARAAGTQVALLWSCHSARHHTELGSLAERLLDPACGNLAAVVATHSALQASWTPRAANRLLHSLTAGDGSDLEQAVTSARQTLSERDPHWAALAYYARPSGGHSVTYDDAGKAAIAALPLEPGNTAGVRVDGLPRRPFYWVDRPAEVAAIVEHLAASRIVTVCGMPGIGKTEIARAAAEHLIAEAALDAALWIAFDEFGSVSDLRARIAAWAGVPDPDAPDARLARAIGARRALWILDGAEAQVRDHGPDLRRFLAALLEPCPGLQLLLTSQRPLGDLRSERERRYLVRRIESTATCQRLFTAAAGSPLDDRADSDDVRAILELLDGHPRSLVLVASQVRDGGANLPRLLAQLRQRGDEAVLAAELLDSGIDWTAHDRLRAERLVSSLHLAYQPLRNHSPGAAELFGWLGALSAGLPVALASAIFGDNAPDRVATLTRVSLVELRGDDERLDLPAPVRWYAARQLAAHVSAERQAELLARTLDALASLMAAAYERIGKPGAGAVIEASRRESQNLEALLDRVEHSEPLTPKLAGLVARAFWRWSSVRTMAGNHASQVMLIERARRLVATGTPNAQDYAHLENAAGDIYLRTAQYADAEHAYQTARDVFSATGEHISEAYTRTSLGDLYLRTDDLQQAEHNHLTALNMFLAAKDRGGEANTRLALGDLHLRRNQPLRAELEYTSALSAFIEIKQQLGQANTHKALGAVYARTNRHKEAASAYERALAGFAAIEEKLGEGYTRKELGDIHFHTGYSDKAEDEYQKALDIFVAIDEQAGIAATQLALGQVYLDSKRPDKAEAACERALNIFLVLKQRIGEANTRRLLGDLFRHKVQFDDAEKAYKLALEIFLIIDEPLSVANTITKLGLLAFARRQPDVAFEQFRSAHTRLRHLNARTEAAIQQAYMAQVARSTNRLDRSIVLADTAYRELRALDSRFNTMLALREISETAEQAENPKLAMPALLLIWHEAKSIHHPAEAELAALAGQFLPAEALAAGLSPDEVTDLERQLADAVAEVAQRLEAAGEDPFGPLAPLASEP